MFGYMFHRSQHHLVPQDWQDFPLDVPGSRSGEGAMWLNMGLQEADFRFDYRIFFDVSLPLGDTGQTRPQELLQAILRHTGETGRGIVVAVLMRDDSVAVLGYMISQRDGLRLQNSLEEALPGAWPKVMVQSDYFWQFYRELLPYDYDYDMYIA